MAHLVLGVADMVFIVGLAFVVIQYYFNEQLIPIKITQRHVNIFAFLTFITTLTLLFIPNAKTILLVCPALI